MSYELLGGLRRDLAVFSTKERNVNEREKAIVVAVGRVVAEALQLRNPDGLVRPIVNALLALPDPVRDAAKEVVDHAEDVRQVFADELIEGAIVLRPETFARLRAALESESHSKEEK